MKRLYISIIDMLQNSIQQHPNQSNEYEKWFIKWMEEAIEQIRMAMDFKNNK